MHTHTHTHAHRHTHTDRRTHINTHTHRHTHKHTDRRTHTHIHIHIHIDTRTHIHTHAQRILPCLAPGLDTFSSVETKSCVRVGLCPEIPAPCQEERAQLTLGLSGPRWLLVLSQIRGDSAPEAACV